VTSNYRILIVEDDDDTREAIAEELADIAPDGGLYWDISKGVREAERMVKAKYYDLILVDLELGKNPRGGLDLYTHLAHISASTRLVLMTHLNVDSGMGGLFSLFGEGKRPRFVGFIDKRENFTRQIRDEVMKRFSEFASYSVEFENIELAARLIDKRRRRYARDGLFPLRTDPGEIGLEVDRLLRKLYVELPAGKRGSSIRVALEPVHRSGLSSAIVVNAVVNVNPDSLAAIPGHKTVLKIGPYPDILEEASRYHEFVRFGVELDQRVEMLGDAAEDTLGALVYSFAGGLHRQDLASLDEVLQHDLLTGDIHLSCDAIFHLFDSKNWYNVVSRNQSVPNYFDENYRSDLMRSAAEGWDRLRELPANLTKNVRVEQASPPSGVTSLRVAIPGAPPFDVPGAGLLGSGALLLRVPTCLVHGDMHGGNVMVESERSGAAADSTDDLKRVCLIDYRNSGFGPRCVDAVALESTIRLADSEAACREVNEMGESYMAARAKATAAAAMARRRPEELQLYRFAFGESPDKPEEPWALLALEVLQGVRKCFSDVTLKEYLATAIPYAIRNLGYDVLPVARVRLCTWLSALTELSAPKDPPRGSRK
jgi:CheY-like chemotaxis protein